MAKWENDLNHPFLNKGCKGAVKALKIAIGRLKLVAAPMTETVLACDPTTSDLPDGQQGVFRNTSTGKVAKWRNVGGVLHAEEEKED